MTEESPIDADVDLITDALVARQGLERAVAMRIARRIASSDADILEAARAWARTGEMPSVPEIARQTPAALSDRLSPSQALTALVALRENPTVAADVLRFSTADSPRARASRWEGTVRQALANIPSVEMIDEQPVGPDHRSRPDFLVSMGDRLFVIEAKATPPRIARLRRAVDQVERYVLVFGAHGGVVVVPAAVDDAPTGFLAPVLITDPEHIKAALEELVTRT